MQVTKEKIEEVLSSLVEKDKLGGIVVDGQKVGFAIESNDESLRARAEKTVFAIPGVEKVTAVLTGTTGKITVENKNTEVLNRKQPVAGVKKIIAVASGKGGVGKSTIAYNLAKAAAAEGKKVGLLDADIYGPSIPHLLQLEGKPPFIDNKIIPHEKDGILCSSVGFIVDEKEATIWRGPMATKALHQLFRGCNWAVNGELDVLFIDMPPGTGDIHLSIAQNYKIDGAVLVTTPKEIALLDVVKAARMFERVDIPVIGLIENMSYFEDAAGNKNYIFGQDGGKNLAKEMKIDLLSQVPISDDIDLTDIINTKLL